MKESKWDIRRGADIYRGIFDSRLKSWIASGRIKKDDVFVWKSGLSGWRRAEELGDLQPYFEKQEKKQLTQKLQKKKKKKKKKKGKPQRRIHKVKNILIIDDEKDLCWLFSDILGRRGYKVVATNTIKEGVSYIKKDFPDMVFLDLKLPDGDGMRAFSKIKKINPQAIVNIISAYGSEERIAEAKRKGVDNFIDKPFNEKKLLSTIKLFDRKR